jgi:hypothetical protein
MESSPMPGEADLDEPSPALGFLTGAASARVGGTLAERDARPFYEDYMRPISLAGHPPAAESSDAAGDKAAKKCRCLSLVFPCFRDTTLRCSLSMMYIRVAEKINKKK